MNPPKVYSCKEWGARPVDTVFPEHPIHGIVVHHTTSPNRTPATGDAEIGKAFDLARSIQSGHFGRGWKDTGNHFLVTRGGVLLEGRHGSLAAVKRGKVVWGAHADDNEANASWVGVEWEGRYDKRYLVTPAQWDAAVTFFAWLAVWGAIDSQMIEPHCHFKATACPGLLKERLPDLRQAVHDRKVSILASKGG